MRFFFGWVVGTMVACGPSGARADTLSAEAAPLFAFSDVVTGLGPVTDFRFLPDGRIVLTEKDGALRVRRPSGEVVLAGTLPVDTESEKGLLGVEVDPGFATNRFLYLYWSRANSAAGTDLDRHRVSRFVLNADDTLGAETVLVQGLRGPANHDGGALAIGPDGKLYIGVGNIGCNSGTGPGEGPFNTFSTCLTNGNGKILRVNLDGSIPEDNPLVGVPQVTRCGDELACREPVSASVTAPPRTDIWAWGFRNPWRFWFDPVTGNLWVGDVGEVTYEEVTVAQRGGHHGYPWREGGAGQPVSRCADVVPLSGDCRDPVYFCGRSAGGGVDGDCQSITGGAIIDSGSWPSAWRGRYLFGDNVSGRLWYLRLNAERTGVAAGTGVRGDVGQIEGGSPVSIRPGPDGNLYIGVLGSPGSGRLVRLAPASPAGAPPALSGGGGEGGGDGCGSSGSPGGAGLALLALLAFVRGSRRRRATRVASTGSTPRR
jgi:uncharacterized protein (TIGR03382 family)